MKIKELPPHELIEVQALSLHERRRLFISGYIDHKNQYVVLFRGDGNSVFVNFRFFEPNKKYSPDFSQLSIIDYGHAVKLGDYEASTHSILSISDPDYQ